MNNIPNYEEYYHKVKATVECNKDDYTKVINLLSLAFEEAKITNNKEIMATIYNEIGSYYMIMRNHEEAIKYFNKAIRMNNSFKDAYVNRGTTKAMLGELKKAIRDYSKAISLDNNFKEVYYNRGNAKFELSEYKQAIRDFNKAIKIDSKYKEAYLNRGSTKAELGEYKQAIEDFNIVKGLDSKLAEELDIDKKIKELKGMINNDNRNKEIK